MVRLALLDMNNNVENQGMGNIIDISKAFQESWNSDVEIVVFDVRHKKEVPNVDDFDIFISSGGPDSPHADGNGWGGEYSDFLNDIWFHNLQSEDKKYLFLICYSYQVAVIHWRLGIVNKRKSYSFGIMPINKTRRGKKEFLFKELSQPFFAVDSRAFQFIQPNRRRISELGMEIMAIEKYRPYVPLERAIMAVRFSDEIFGTQFHPEAEAEGFMKNLENEEKRNALIKQVGWKKYQQTIYKLHDPKKIPHTQAQILPGFLKHAATQVEKHVRKKAVAVS